jgi:hypothetical protein
VTGLSGGGGSTLDSVGKNGDRQCVAALASRRPAVRGRPGLEDFNENLGNLPPRSPVAPDPSSSGRIRPWLVVGDLVPAALWVCAGEDGSWETKGDKKKKKSKRYVTYG